MQAPLLQAINDLREELKPTRLANCSCLRAPLFFVALPISFYPVFLFANLSVKFSPFLLSDLCVYYGVSLAATLSTFLACAWFSR